MISLKLTVFDLAVSLKNLNKYLKKSKTLFF